MKKQKVLYVYRCGQCGHRGETHFEGDGFDGAAGTCTQCLAAIVWEWDGGVDLRPKAKTTAKP